MLTKSEQLLLLELLLKKRMKKNDQDIYESFKFYPTMSKLKDFGLIDCKTKKGNEKIYFLTFPKGWVRANSISWDNNNDKKYKELRSDVILAEPPWNPM